MFLTTRMLSLWLNERISVPDFCSYFWPNPPVDLHAKYQCVLSLLFLGSPSQHNLT